MYFSRPLDKEFWLTLKNSHGNTLQNYLRTSQLVTFSANVSCHSFSPEMTGNWVTGIFFLSLSLCPSVCVSVTLSVSLSLKILQGKTHGFFVECGAGNGYDLSNSLFFELHRSWTGLLIEPNPELFLPLLGAKRKSYITNSCLSTSNKSQSVIFAPLMSLGGIVDKYDPSHFEWLRAQADYVNKKGNITAQCFTLYSLLLAVGQTEVDYFSLDVEGPELDILQTIPFDKIAIDVISIEYKVLGVNRREGRDSSLKKLQNIRNFFKALGTHREAGILPWGRGMNPRRQEADGLDVIFKRI